MSQIDSVAIAKQSAYGTKQLTAEYYSDVEGATYDDKPDPVDVTTTVGYKFPAPLDMGKQVGKVEVDLIPRVAAIPRWLSMYFGTPTTTTVDTTGHKHVFDPVAASALIYHTLRLTRKDPASAIVDAPFDCAGKQLVISGAVGDFLKAKATIISAQNDNGQSAPTVTLDATERFLWHKTKLYANVDAGGEAEVKCNSFEWTYDTGLEDDHFIMGAQALAALPVGFQTAMLKFTMTEESASTFVTWYRRALALTGRNSIIFRTDTVGTTLAGASTQYNEWETKAWNCEIIDAPAQIDAKSRLRQIEITARCNYQPTGTHFFDNTVYNAVASY